MIILLLLKEIKHGRIIQKELRFEFNNFNKFKDKIIYIPVEDLPDGDNPYERENHQRNAISRGLI